MSRESEKKEETVELLEDIESLSKLIVHNDEVNTFDHVIKCLIRICKHEPAQAEQSATIIHYKGKAVVKTGDRTEIKSMCQALCDEGLSATIGD